MREIEGSKVLIGESREIKGAGEEEVRGSQRKEGGREWKDRGRGQQKCRERKG